MKLGDVLKKERERKKLSIEQAAAELGVSIPEYEGLESGSSPIEEWGPKLAQIAIKVSTPTSRLISETGQSYHASPEEKQCGRLVGARREELRLSREELARRLEWPVAQLAAIEKGESPLENYAPLLLRFSDMIEQPIFNLFYPCGLPLEEISDYP